MNDQVRPDIFLHIEHLFLDGVDVPPAQQEELLASLQAELTRLFGEGGLNESLAGGGAYEELPAAPINQPNPATPGSLGRQVAQSVYGSMGE